MQLFVCLFVCFAMETAAILVQMHTLSNGLWKLCPNMAVCVCVLLLFFSRYIHTNAVAMRSSYALFAR